MYKMSFSKNIVIFATDAATISGKNRYKSVSSVFEKMVNRYKPDLCKFADKTEILTKTYKIEENTKCESSEEIKSTKRKIISEKTKQIKQDFEDIATFVNDPDKLSKQKRQKSQQLMKQLAIQPDQQLDKKCEEVVRDTTQIIESGVNTSFGKRKECTVIDWYQQQCEQPVNTPTTFFKRWIGSDGDYHFYVGGKIDGKTIDADGNIKIVEVKNRVNRLFKRLYEYEKVQVQTYLYVLDVPTADLVECLTQQNQKSYNIINVKQDLDYYNQQVLPKLLSYCRYFISFLNSPDSDYLALQTEEEKNNYIRGILDE